MTSRSSADNRARAALHHVWNGEAHARWQAERAQATPNSEDHGMGQVNSKEVSDPASCHRNACDKQVLLDNLEPFIGTPPPRPPPLPRGWHMFGTSFWFSLRSTFH